MSGSNNASSGGIGVFGLLLVLFIGLKITGNIDWSWWWVTAPLWGPTTILLLVVAIWVSIDMIFSN